MSVLKDLKRKLQQIQRSLETADLQGITRKTGKDGLIADDNGRQLSTASHVWI